MDDKNKRIFVYNICHISISATVSDGVIKTLVLNIERYTARLTVLRICARCIEYFFVRRGFKIFFAKNVSAH